MNDFRKLENSILEDDFEKFQNVVNSGVDLNSKVDSIGNILHLYIECATDLQFDPKKMIDFLVKKNIDINAQTKPEKLTPLRISVIHQQPQICELLLKHGCDTELPDEDGNTPLWAAIMQYRGEEKLRTIIKLLLQAGADISKKNAHGISPASLINENGKSIDLGNNKKEWDLRPLMKELGIKI